jgi:hypothetical protein
LSYFRKSSLVATMILGLVAAQFAACSGGGAGSDVRTGGSNSGSGAGSGDGTSGGPGSTGACGLTQASGVPTAGPAEGAWTGAFPIFSGVDLVFGNGVVTAEGKAVFNVGNSELWVGTVLATEDGAVASDLTLYKRPSSGGAGGLKSPGDPTPEALVFDHAKARTALSGAYQGPLSNCQDVRLGYDDVYEQAASLQEIAGVYTSAAGDDYTLTVTVHDDGQLDGSDTRGCVLMGDVSVPDATKNVYRAVADASSCGDLDGHYDGPLSLRYSAGRLSWLDLALTAPDKAIFYRLSR